MKKRWRRAGGGKIKKQFILRVRKILKMGCREVQRFFNKSVRLEDNIFSLGMGSGV